MVSPHVPEDDLELVLLADPLAFLEDPEGREDILDVLRSEEGLDNVGPIQAIHAIGPGHSVLSGGRDKEIYILTFLEKNANKIYGQM